MDFNNISLRPQYGNKTEHTTATTKVNSKDDVWGFYKKPYINPNKEYIERRYAPRTHHSKIFEYNYEILDSVMPVYKHLLKSNEIYKFYLKTKNKYKGKSRKYNTSKSGDSTNAPNDNIVVPGDDGVIVEDVLDDSEISSDDSEYLSEVDEDYDDDLSSIDEEIVEKVKNIEL